LDAELIKILTRLANKTRAERAKAKGQTSFRPLSKRDIMDVVNTASLFSQVAESLKQEKQETRP
jgi:hypothetical protein